MQLYRTLYISTVCIKHCSATLLWHQCKSKWNWGKLPHWLGYICFDYRFNASKGVDSWFNLVTIKISNVSVNTLLNRDNGKMEVDWPRSWHWGCIKRRSCDSCVFLPSCLLAVSVLPPYWSCCLTILPRSIETESLPFNKKKSRLDILLTFRRLIC